MHDAFLSNRLSELFRSPGGCSLLVMMAHHALSPREAVEPVTALHLVAQAVGQLSPWAGVHDELVARVRRDAEPHQNLAQALLREPGIERWWAPLDRERQVWIEPEMRRAFPTPEKFPTPDGPPTRTEQYVQWPERHVVTSTEVGAWTSQLAALADHVGDWNLNYPACRKRVRISPMARVCEIITAEDWHTLVARHGIQSQPYPSPEGDTARRFTAA